MARKFAHMDWNLQEGANGSPFSWADVDRAILMDIREHLKALRAVFECQNAIRIPHILDRIDANTRKPLRKPKRKAKR